MSMGAKIHVIAARYIYRLAARKLGEESRSWFRESVCMVNAYVVNYVVCAISRNTHMHFIVLLLATQSCAARMFNT